MYKQLTRDKSASNNPTKSEIGARIKQIVDREDPDLIWDLNTSHENSRFFTTQSAVY